MYIYYSLGHPKYRLLLFTTFYIDFALILPHMRFSACFFVRKTTTSDQVLTKKHLALDNITTTGL